MTVRHFNFAITCLSGLMVLLCIPSLRAQNWQIVDSLAYPLPYSVCSDGNGGIFAATENGTIQKLTQQGDTLRTYQPASQEAPTLLPWQMLRLQAYFPFQQKLVLLDQNLNDVSSIILPETTSGNATLSADQQVWYVSADLTLKKYNPAQEENTLATSLHWFLSTASPIKLLQEYQNRLYIQTDEELLIFDLFGNFLSKLQLETNDIVQFFGSTVYFISDDEAHFIDVYSSATYKEPLPPGKNILNFLVEKEYIHGFSERFWFVYANANQAQK